MQEKIVIILGIPISETTKLSQSAVTCARLITKTLEQSVKYVQSLQ